MSDFIVSARKYRPVTFESVVGQKHITDTLRNAVMRGTLAHAYLFCGPRGVGKTTCARILAKTINCMSPGPDAEPCNECESCRSFGDNRSFNIHELDAASNNSVDNIRALTEQVRIPPQVGRYSIYIIDEAHMLSTAAFNAFLKTLEEPPAHAIFILATTEKHKIIPTILSRCQIYDFKRIKADDVVGYLRFISDKEGVSYDDEALHIIAQKADGCMRDALSMYDKTVLFCGGRLTGHAVAEALNVLDYDTYFNFVDAVTSGDYASALMQFDEVLQKGFDPQIFLGGLSSHLRNLLVAKNDATMPLLEVSGSVAERYRKQAAAVQVSFVFDALSIASSGERDIRNSNSQRLHSEIAILKMCNLSPLKLSGGSQTTTYTLPSITSAPAPQPAAQTPPVAQPKPAAPSAPAVPSVPSPADSRRPAEAPAVEAPPATAPEPKVAQPQMPSSPTGRNSRLGLSIGTMISDASKRPSVAEEPASEGVLEPCKIAESDTTAVMEGCRAYAAELMERRPRLAMAFNSAKIEDGAVVLTLNSKIVEQEVVQNKHEFVVRLMALSGVERLDINTVVDETLEEVKTILVKDEDKLKFLSEKNGAMKQLCSELNLDFC